MAGNRIASVRRTMLKADGGQDAWNGVTAGFIDRLGRGSDDAFNPGQFMRSWNKLSPEAKGAIFDGTPNAQFKTDLDRLARIADNFGKYSKGANHSNTSNHQAIKESLNPLSKENAIISFLGGAVTGDPISGALLGAGKGVAKFGASRLSQSSRAKLMTSPETVNWLVGLPKAEMTKGGVKGHIKKLYEFGKNTRHNALAAAIDDYLRDLKYSDEDR